MRISRIRAHLQRGSRDRSQTGPESGSAEGMAAFLRNSRALPAVTGIVIVGALVAGCGGGSESAESANWREATSVEDGGGMKKLIKDAKAEGQFNAMGLFDDWANYGGVLDAFSKKYDIEINNDTSTGSSQDLINAVERRKGQDNSLDYLDVGLSFADTAEKDGLLAEYAPQTADDIPKKNKSAKGFWYNHLGGTIAIGCDTSRVKKCPKTLKELRDPRYKGQVGIPGDPGSSENAFMVVAAASLASGGSLDNIEPGVKFFGELKKLGVFVPVEANAGTIEKGETPIVLDWDYLLKPIANQLAKDSDITFDITLPSDGKLSSFYTASINADAPNPAVARLFYEFLFSDEGQNLLLKGYVSPIRLATMIKAGTVDKEALKALPGGGAVTAPSPSLQQRETNQTKLKKLWPKAMK